MTVPIDDMFLGYVARTGVILNCHDASIDPRFNAALVRHIVWSQEKVDLHARLHLGMTNVKKYSQKVGIRQKAWAAISRRCCACLYKTAKTGASSVGSSLLQIAKMGR